MKNLCEIRAAHSTFRIRLKGNRGDDVTLEHLRNVSQSLPLRSVSFSFGVTR
jgi:hypothetical protein